MAQYRIIHQSTPNGEEEYITILEEDFDIPVEHFKNTRCSIDSDEIVECDELPATFPVGYTFKRLNY